MRQYFVMSVVYWASMFVAFLFLPISTGAQIALPAIMALYVDFLTHPEH